MILVLGGTKDAGEVIKTLNAEGYKVTATAVSSYGGELAKASGAEEILVGSLDHNSFAELLKAKGIKAVIDATHPYAVAITKLAWQICQEHNITYLRHARPSGAWEMEEGNVCWVDSYEAGAKLAFKLGNVVMTTTGSKNLAYFLAAKGPGQRLVVRVLPECASIIQCRELGLAPKDIVAMQGPFSININKALFKEYGVQVVVTKDSGKTGGIDTKLAAARELQLPVVIIKRPDELEIKNCTIEEILQELGRKINCH